MRLVTSFAAVVFLCGCTSTQVIDADWNDPAINQQLQRIGQSGSGRVLLVPPGGGHEGAFALTESGLELFDGRRQLERRHVAEIRYTVAKRRGRAFLVGTLVGTAVGVGIGAALASGDNCLVEENPLDVCDLVEAGADPVTIVGMSLLGSLTGGLIGALIGAPKFQVYRFRPDTPQQMSVVIGVGPNAAASRRGR